MEESRKQFETEWEKSMEYLSQQPVMQPWKNACWHFWQASRQAIEIDIDWPEPNDDTYKDGVDGAYARGYEDGKDKVVIATRKAIRAAGLRIKGE